MPEAVEALRRARLAGRLHASEVARLEVLADMRPPQGDATRTLFGAFQWHPLDEGIAEIAGDLGRQWLPGNRGIDSADLAIAATALALEARLLTRNVKHFPMFNGLSSPDRAGNGRLPPPTAATGHIRPPDAAEYLRSASSRSRRYSYSCAAARCQLTR